MLAFGGPAYLVSVGYMDPGNWATDLEGGARFGYGLLWVLVLSNLMAILLQTLSARLGIVAGRDLAQACRESYPKPVCDALWVLCEIAIAACDLAEVLGAAIGLHLLFGIPLVIGVSLTALDTILVLWFSRYGIRLIEALILALIAVMTACFGVELAFAKPVFHEMLSGLVPRLNGQSLYIAIGILGATVMPHNLYLHSALVQTRRIGRTIAEKREACRYNLADSVIALNGALIVNAAILIMAAAVFFKHGVIVTEIEQAHELLTPSAGDGGRERAFSPWRCLASGQSSTLTGTFAGQIVMEGFLNLRLRPWLRRMITRFLAIIPAVITVYFWGAQGTLQLIILSQVILSMQLPFAVIPLIRFTSDKARMGEFANRAWVKIACLDGGRGDSRPELLVRGRRDRTVDGCRPVARAAGRSFSFGHPRFAVLDQFLRGKSDRARQQARRTKYRRGSAGARLSPYPGASRPLLARPRGHCAFGRHGQGARLDAAPAARRRRSHQHSVRAARFRCRDSVGRGLFPRNHGVARR